MRFGDLRAQMDCLLASAVLESFPRDARWAGFQELNLPSDSLLSSSLLPIPQLHFRVSNFLGFRRSWTKLESNIVVPLAGLSAPLPQQKLRLSVGETPEAQDNDPGSCLAGDSRGCVHFEDAGSMA